MLDMNVTNLNPKKNPNQKSKKNKVILSTWSVLVFSCLGFQSAYAEELMLRPQSGVEQFSFSLPSNPTTGYRWSVRDYDASKLKFLGSSYHGKQTKLIGSGGQQTFKFLILKPKQVLKTDIHLDYSRPWEKQPIKTEKVSVKTLAPHFFNLFKW